MTPGPKSFSPECLPTIACGFFEVVVVYSVCYSAAPKAVSVFFADEDPTTEDHHDAGDDEEVTRFVPLTLADGEHVLKVCASFSSVGFRGCTANVSRILLRPLFLQRMMYRLEEGNRQVREEALARRRATMKAEALAAARDLVRMSKAADVFASILKKK
jgi:hypothetical protein